MILKELKVKRNCAAVFAANEIVLSIKARVKNSSWQTKNAETAVLTVFVDDKYNQDAILFAGAETFEHRMLLGKYDSGAHRVTIILNRRHSAPNAANVEFQTVFANFYEDLTATKTFDRSITAYLAMINAPLIYLRPETIGKFSDVPLLTFYEIFDEPENVKRIRYTTIFSNEDGGTQSAALLARSRRFIWLTAFVKKNGAIFEENLAAYQRHAQNNGAPPEIIEKMIEYTTTLRLVSEDRETELLREAGFAEIRKVYQGIFINGWLCEA